MHRPSHTASEWLRLLLVIVTLPIAYTAPPLPWAARRSALRSTPPCHQPHTARPSLAPSTPRLARPLSQLQPLLPPHTPPSTPNCHYPPHTLHEKQGQHLANLLAGLSHTAPHHRLHHSPSHTRLHMSGSCLRQACLSATPPTQAMHCTYPSHTIVRAHGHSGVSEVEA